MSKAILLVRVSTERQDFDEQERELYQLALSDGFTEENIIPICEKESGIKLKEEERRGLNQMKEVISAGGVTCVYAWEPSRIARKKKVLFSITEYLTERGIQLIIKEPYIILLNPDGSINDGAETVLTLFGQLAESEMRNKQARWHRTHIANSKSGKWNGGPCVRYGYTLDDNNYYIIDKDEAEVVRKVFELYTTTSLGTTGVVRELQKLGYDVSYNRVSRILTCEHYTGKLLQAEYWVNNPDTTSNKKSIKVKGLEIKYPAIISEEIFEEARRRRQTNNSNAYKKDSYYLGRGLMTCPTCGSKLVADKGNGWYLCNDVMHRGSRRSKCNDKTSIGINVADTILWDATVSEYINANKISVAEKIEKAKIKIAECKRIITAAADRLEKAEKKQKKLSFIFVDTDDMTEEEYKKRKEQIATERRQIESERVSAEERIKQYQKVIEGRDESNMVSQLISLSEDAFSINELKEMCELVHLYLDRVELSQDAKRYKYITIYATSGEIYKYRVRYNGHKQIYWREADNVMMKSFSPWVEFTPNITIIRKVGHLSKRDMMEQPFRIIKNTEMDYNIQNQVDNKSDEVTGINVVMELTNALNKK